jgi:hypothetical protein
LQNSTAFLFDKIPINYQKFEADKVCFGKLIFAAPQRNARSRSGHSLVGENRRAVDVNAADSDWILMRICKGCAVGD